MELDLNELERRAKSAGGQEWTLTIDATGDAFLSAENSEYVAEVGAVGEDGIASDYGKFIAAANPAVVLELVRRLREAEGHVTARIDEAVEAEREACAKVCEQQIRRAGDGMTFYTAVGQCAAAIRTRSIQPARGEG